MRGMSDRRIVTLLTDFGGMDGYVAAVKGVVLSLAPDAVIVDASHEIAPQDVRAGAWVLGQYWASYPEGSIHLAVVDPGVGTDRAALLVEADGRIVLAPDNGILMWVLRQASRVRLARLRPDVHRPGEISTTFHGRDVFAHAAGLLAGGQARPEDLSEVTKEIVMPSWAVVRKEPERLVGEIVHVDRFGNLVTNISRRQADEMGWAAYVVQAGALTSIALKRTYGEVEPGTVLALYGASDTLEIAVSGGSAAVQTKLMRGMPVIVRRLEKT
jgi:S-adenosyl-L-methionine hydrolase (adenosine-forming)